MANAGFDITLTIDGTAYRCKLMDDSKGGKMWSVADIGRQTNDPTKPFFTQTDWSGGFGDGNFAGRNKYADGQNIDTLQDGQICLGPLLNTTYCKNFPDAAISDDGGVYDDETADAVSVTASDIVLLPAIPAQEDAFYIGYTDTFTSTDIVIGTQGAGTWTITWEYYDTDTTWKALSGVTDGTTGFTAAAGSHTVSFTKPATWATTTVNSQGAYYYIRGRVSAYTSVTTQPLGTQMWVYEAAIMDASAGVLFYEIFGSKLYCATANKIFEWDSSNVYWIARWETTGTISALQAFAGVLYIGMGGGTKYYYTTNVLTFVQNTLTDGYATYFVVAPAAAGTTNILWKARAVAGNPNEVSNTTNGTSVQWTTVDYIGDTSNLITNLMLAQDRLLVGKEDGMYHLDSDGKVYPLLPTPKGAGAFTNFRADTEYQGALYFTAGPSVGEITSYSTIDWMGPFEQRKEISLTTTQSYTYALTAEEKYLYAMTYLDANKGTLYKGSYNIASNTWQWCPWVYSTTFDVGSGMRIDDLSSPRKLWFSDGNHPSYVILSDDPPVDTNASFATSGYLETGWIDMGDRDWKKLLEALLAECRGDTAAGITTTLSYKTDEGSWKDTTAIAAATAGTKHYTSEVSGVTNVASFNKVKFKIALASNNSTKTPVVKFFAAYGQIRPPQTRVMDFTIDVENPKQATSKVLRDALISARSSTSFVTIVDVFGATSYIEVLPGYPEEIFIKQPYAVQPHMGLHVKAIVIDWS